MFKLKSIRLKNFKAFQSVNIDFQQKKNSVKPLAIIYGSNGSGKTTLAESIAFFLCSIDTMSQSHRLQKLMQNADDSFPDSPFKKEFLTENINHMLKVGSMRQLINDVINANHETMSVELDFDADGNSGSYRIETNRSGIIGEKLVYTLAKNRVVCFEYSGEKWSLNQNIFLSDEFEELIRKNIEMFSGKHSMLSMISFEMKDKKKEFVAAGLNPQIYDLMLHFRQIDIYLHHSTLRFTNDSHSFNGFLMQHLDYGVIPKTKSKYLKNIEKDLAPVLSGIFPEIQTIYYRTESNEDEKSIQYQLFLKKKMGGSLYDLPFPCESTGTKKILQILPYLLYAMKGHTVVIDEYGSELHDMMARSLLESVLPHISGQLILTTHVTSLMNGNLISSSSPISPNAFYFITSSSDEVKTIVRLGDMEKRTYSNYNYQDRYLSRFIVNGVLPSPDLQETLFELSQKLNDEERP